MLFSFYVVHLLFIALYILFYISLFVYLLFMLFILFKALFILVKNGFYSFLCCLLSLNLLGLKRENNPTSFITPHLPN